MRDIYNRAQETDLCNLCVKLQFNLPLRFITDWECACSVGKVPARDIVIKLQWKRMSLANRPVFLYEVRTCA